MTKHPFAAARRTAAAHAFVAVLTVGFSHAAVAGERSLMLKISEQQMQAMSITVQPLQTAVTGGTANFPAQVVVPQGGERMVSTPVVALIEQVLVQPGQEVKAGAPLLRLASTELGQAQLQLAQAGARARLAQQNLTREQALFAEGIIPERRVQEAKSASTQAQAEVNQASSALRLMGLPMSAMNRVASGGQAQDGLTVVAPQAGIVSDIAVHAGQRVEASNMLLRLVNQAAISLEIQVPVAQVGAFPVGTTLQVLGRNLAGRVVSASAVVAPGSQTSTLRATLNDSKAGTSLRPGEAVTVQLAAQGPSVAGWTVPLSAVAYDGKKAHVFVKSPQGFEARPVQVLGSTGQLVRVAGALKAGESVAVTGVIALKGAWMKEAP
jgi:cobalt-zinc-cadmium efflux system membrane fusion protein